MAVQVEQRTEVKRHLITLEEYERMCVAGVFDEGVRVELIRGEIVDMPPPGPEHESSITRLHLVFFEQVRRQAIVWPQGNSIRLHGSDSRPQPDISILQWRDDLYRGKSAAAEDAILVVEVAQSSLKYDHGAKLTLYAEAGIPEYWVVNLVDKIIEVYAEPSEGEYQLVRRAKRGETLPLPGGLEGSIVVDDILG